MNAKERLVERLEAIVAERDKRDKWAKEVKARIDSGGLPDAIQWTAEKALVAHHEGAFAASALRAVEEGWLATWWLDHVLDLVQGRQWEPTASSAAWNLADWTRASALARILDRLRGYTAIELEVSAPDLEASGLDTPEEICRETERGGGGRGDGLVTAAQSSDPVADALKLWLRFQEANRRASALMVEFSEFISTFTNDETKRLGEQMQCEEVA